MADKLAPVTLTVDSEALDALGVRLIVTFGSRPRGTHRPSSDLDVGVQFSPGSRIGLGLLDGVRAALRAPAEIDLVVLEWADPLLLREVAVDGSPVFEDAPGAWEEFRLLAVKRYYDTAWIRDLEAAALRARGGDGPP